MYSPHIFILNHLLYLYLTSHSLSTMSKQLGELLREQQEPFVLETYLLERGCLKKSLTSSEEGGTGTGFCCCYGNLKRSANSDDLNMTGKGIPQCSKILRSIFDKLLSISGEVGSNSKKVAEQDKFSSASSTTVFNSCSRSDTEDSLSPLQILHHHPCSTATTVQVLKRKKQREEEVQRRRSKKKRFRFRAVSVLGGSSVGQSNAKTRKQQKSSMGKSGFSNRVIDDESVSSACLLELLVQSPRIICFRPKRVLQQRRKLLFDCVREVVEAHQRRQPQQSIGVSLRPEGLKQLVCHKIRAWEKQSGKETRIINHLLKFDFVASTQEWNDLKRESRKLGLEIGEAILEEMINEMVAEMFEHYMTISQIDFISNYIINTC